MYDYLIVGAGLSGAIFAHEATKRGKKVKVIDKRDHIGGNIYCEEVEGINVHKYGAHIFHTSNKKVWDYVNQFAEFNNYINSPVANYKGNLYNLPFNMNTFYAMWGTKTPQEVKDKIAEQTADMKDVEPKNLEEQAIKLIGPDIYEKLIKGYTEKQWGRSATDLPPFIIKRLPVRLTFDNNYFNDRYQGIPIGGYNVIIENMLGDVEVELGVDFFANREELEASADKVVFTGMIAPSETALYYKAADFFISASTSETQGLTYLESLASGTPVIAHGNPYLDNVITDQMFGTLYYHDNDLAGAILEAAIATPEKDETKWADKLYEISAENFGKRVYEYYLDLTISKDFHNDLNGEDSTMKRLTRMVTYLPTKAITLPVNGSVRILKGSAKQVKKIRNITKLLD